MQTPPTPRTRDAAGTRQRLIDAAVRLMLRQGFAATSVDEICRAAAVTKGAFFHHFPNKEALTQAAVDWWGRMGTDAYAAAWQDPSLDPLEQLDRFFDIMISFNQRAEDPCVCMVGMMSQELALTNPAMRAGCEGHLQDWTEHAVRLLDAARAKHGVAVGFDAQEVAWFLNSLWQGSMLVGKTRQQPAMVIRNLEFARQWVKGFFPKLKPTIKP